MAWLPEGKKKLLIICLAVSTEYRRVPDRQTARRPDKRTDRHLATA